MEILKADVADAPEILALQKRAYLSEAKRYNDFSIPPMTQTEAELAEDFSRKTFLKAMEGGRIIGAVNGFITGDRCRIGRLMVHPDFRGRGIGTRLLAAVEARFGDARTWELFTGELSLENVRLYERLGYRIISKERFENSRFAIVIMEKARES
jgi:ribosomal protein S18 acetylase RimI-like enzyme